MIRLTADRPSQKGWLWGKQMLTSTAWMVEFEFKVGSDNNNYADGFAFWYTLESEKEGPVFGSTDKFNGLGLFFDTYSNGRHDHDFPYVASMIGDGLTTYDLDRDGKTHSIGGCQSSFRRMDWPTRARVKYVRGSLLEVHLNVRASNQWEECFSVANVTLPTMGHIGFSAHTGDLTDNHDIISVIVNGIVNPKAQKILPSANTATRSTERPEKQKPSKPAKGGSFSVTGILIFLLVLGAVGGGLYYYSNHVRRPPKAYKRF
ncbi:legume-like lectin family-domain-containing protein [Zopfochytrium polystomum]|nr:legume-like lectin family-domain-containing protein [Zopfochytrium polystomum]